MVWLKQIIEDGRYAKFKLNLDIIEKSLAEKNTNGTVEASKALIESVCKTISGDLGLKIDSAWNVPKVVSETLKVTPFVKNMEKDDADRTKAICGCILTIASKIAEFRNDYGFMSHGRDIEEAKKCDEVISQLVYFSTDIICSFLIEIHTNFSTLKDLKRVDYEKYKEFNEWFDDENGDVIIGALKFSASQTLYNNDISAYIDALNDYFDKIDKIESPQDDENVTHN